MGDSQSVLALKTLLDSVGDFEPEQRLVVVTPFFLDATEVTVGRYTPTAMGVITPWSGDLNGDAQADFCTWNSARDRADLPTNCVSWAAARAHCQAHGADLPTEAQFEYAQSGLRSSDYVWGNASPECDDAVWGRGRGGLGFPNGARACRDSDDIGGVAPPGTGARDRLQPSTGGEVVDLAGNVAEWTFDVYQPSDNECWPEGIVHDPVCHTTGQTATYYSIRGGSWAGFSANLRAALRSARSAISADPAVGFRCARADDPTP